MRRAGGVLWKHAACTYVDVPDVQVNTSTYMATCPAIASGAPLQCYCICREPAHASANNDNDNDNDNDDTWVIAAAPDIKGHHVPWHATDFRFPFQLPLYPDTDILFVRVTLERQDGDAPSLRPLYLGCTPPVKVAAVCDLRRTEWLSPPTLQAWATAAENTTAILAAAFDGMWDCTVQAVTAASGDRCTGDGTGDKDDNDDDTVAFLSTDAIEEVDYDEHAFVSVPLFSNAPEVMFQSDDVGVVSVIDDVPNDDDDDISIDTNTGLVASSTACMDDNDDDMESIDGDTDAESENDLDEDDDEDDVDDDDGA